MTHQHKRPYSIGELSRLTAVSIETIRYYEHKGILPEPGRTTGGNRQYDQEHLVQLSFVKNCRDLGFPLKEISELSTLMNTDDFCCNHLREATVAHTRKIEDKIASLQSMLSKLETMTKTCAQSQSTSCSVIEELLIPSRGNQAS